MLKTRFSRDGFLRFREPLGGQVSADFTKWADLIGQHRCMSPADLRIGARKSARPTLWLQA